jgi:acetyltransferase-like isoleucine patch superfamily enzyme
MSDGRVQKDGQTLYRTIAVSDHWFPRLLRAGRRFVQNLSMPAPRAVTVPLVSAFLMARSVYYFVARVFFCEPFFKSYCSKYGKNLHTGVFLHWIQGRGVLIVGDNVVVDGKCSFFFAARYSARPTLIIGDNTGIGHNSSFTVGTRIEIGRHCRIATGVAIFDAPGHPLDPAMRLAGNPAAPEDARPVVIEDNVWIGQSVIIMPGVTIGEGSVVAAGSVVTTSVPANILVAGNPARQVRSLAKAAPREQDQSKPFDQR